MHSKFQRQSRHGEVFAKGDDGSSTSKVEKETVKEIQEECARAKKMLEDENEKKYSTAKKELEELRHEFQVVGEHLKHSFTMMELKDLSQPGLSKGDTIWFMSSLHGSSVDDQGKPEEFRFPSTISQGRLLCLQGNHTHNGTMNKYGFAWKGFLPDGATYLPGLTLVADNYWDYVNPWHSMSAIINFAAWRVDNGCKVPARIVAYHWGEMVTKMGDWITNVLHASMGVKLRPDTLSSYGSGPVCFEDAIVQRRGLGGMSKERMNRLFDVVRCKVYKFCKVAPRSFVLGGKDGRIDITLVARSGPREFSNLSGVVSAVSEQCAMVKGCKLDIVSIGNLSFCEQVEVMSKSDVLLTAHGAQLTNMMFMPRGGSVMELFPKGWLEFAGVGQYIYTWLADWTGLKHEGAWRDPDGPDCPYDTKTQVLECFLFYKDRSVGLNSSHLSSWTADVLERIQARRASSVADHILETSCSCDSVDRFT
ncbi:uncharacterized protein LOC9660179 isoform X3 [Selaginella moellendorffii]|uniref:uncharacterized protein LOC9660179 isoform X3 n=1 Tax=Selaginella moellendorffii TaxID=88036 RepID=UPI000D1C9B4B|nr:uncharacterized protein LOC9660179 isoform X3 [Selaginella moellendorffii]|eukprot:XP_002965175.2 uncharacterized protein LOC9660179 isoform X3 [Selaginella moellendorffii]